MTEVLFYHLERASLELVLPDLLEKTLARGWKAVVRTGSIESVKRLDELLWTYKDESFLPHGAGDATEASRQPVWLTAEDDAPNEPDLLYFVDGAEMTVDGVEKFVRCVTIFDGGDEAALSAARAFWRAAKEKGHAVAYWKQSPEGRWEKQEAS